MGKVEKGFKFHQFYLVFLLSFLLFAGALLMIKCLFQN